MSLSQIDYYERRILKNKMLFDYTNKKIQFASEKNEHVLYERFDTRKLTLRVIRILY